MEEQGMHGILDWIDESLKEIALVLPELVEENPSSFVCGLKMGYKEAVLDLQKFLDQCCIE